MYSFYSWMTDFSEITMAFSWNSTGLPWIKFYGFGGNFLWLSFRFSFVFVCSFFFKSKGISTLIKLFFSTFSYSSSSSYFGGFYAYFFSFDLIDLLIRFTFLCFFPSKSAEVKPLWSTSRLRNSRPWDYLFFGI